MIGLLALHLVVGMVVVAWGRRLGRRSAWLALIPPVATLIWLAGAWSTIRDGGVRRESVDWVPALDLSLSLHMDGFSALMIVLISGVGTLVFAYAAGYLSRTGPRVGRLVGLLVLFAGAMLGLVVADNLLIVYAFWELTSITSFLLIGNDNDKPEARAAALQALLITGAGGLAMLGGFLMLGSAAGTFSLQAILADPPGGATVSAALVLILLGAFTKSAQVPFHSWLPGAMVAPTPVSAYLHSATMVKAGVYLIARFSPAFATVGWWRPVVVGVGAVTMLVGGLKALRQHDLKLLLAHGTVSQLGFMIAIFGLGTPEAMIAGSALLLAHAAFKAANFMAVGIVDHQFGTRDLRRLPKLDLSWAPTGIAAVVGAASMAGIPLTLGFIAKELDLAAVLDAGPGGWVLAKVAIIAGAALTAGYSLRFAAGLLGRDATEPVDRVPSEVRPSPTLTVPMLVLTVATIVFGLAPFLLDRVVEVAEVALHPDPEHVHLAIWHGVNAPLLSSLFAIAAGVALYLARGRITRGIVRAGRWMPDGNAGYRRSLQILNGTADLAVRYAQPGSLPVYAGIILVTAALLPLSAVIAFGGWPGWPDLVDTSAHVPIAAAIIGAAVAASAVRRRFSAAVFLSIVGYSMSALFVVQGAPDLALTQAAIETLSTVLFVLVLRRLPDRFGWAPSEPATTLKGKLRNRLAGNYGPTDSPMTARIRALRVVAALIVGCSVFVLAIVMSGPEPTTPSSDEMVERALPDGHGRNVVNVILVDFRGYDTLGEITVLACAAIGTVALARSGRRPARRRDEQRLTLRRSPLGVAETPSAPDPEPIRLLPQLKLGRVVVLDVAVRIVFAAVMVGAVYLLTAGHNQPGGGFVGGILAGAAVSLRYINGGIESVRSISRARPWTVLGAGLVLAAGSALVPVILGHPMLTSAYRSFDVPLIGSMSVSSVLVFDLGVFLAVLALALMMFESFGESHVVDETVEGPDDRPDPAVTHEDPEDGEAVLTGAGAPALASREEVGEP